MDLRYGHPGDRIPLSEVPGFEPHLLPDWLLGPAVAEHIFANAAIGATEWHMGTQLLSQPVLLTSVTVIPLASTSISAYLRIGLATIAPVAAGGLEGVNELGIYGSYEDVGLDRIHLASAGGAWTIPLRRRIEPNGRRWCLQMTAGTAACNGGICLTWHTIPAVLPRWALRYLRILD
jgi:hypothetical protein